MRLPSLRDPIDTGTPQGIFSLLASCHCWSPISRGQADAELKAALGDMLAGSPGTLVRSSDPSGLRRSVCGNRGVTLLAVEYMERQPALERQVVGEPVTVAFRAA